MISADFLSKMGVYVVKNFLDAQVCANLRAVAPTAAGKNATVTSRGKDVYDETTRKTFQVTLPTQIEEEIYLRVTSLRPELEKYFNVRLEDCRAPILLAYGVGDFFARHRDTYDDPELDLPDNIRKRKLSVVIMLNDTGDADEADTYSGGALTFYDLIPDPRLKSRGFPLKAEEGLLVAFNARMIHEVQPVMRGKRYTIVTWFV